MTEGAKTIPLDERPSLEDAAVWETMGAVLHANDRRFAEESTRVDSSDPMI
jgi:hypothetical protein